MFQRSIWIKVIASFLVLALTVSVLVACDDDDDNNTPEITTPGTVTTTPTTPTGTETSPTLSGDPVKIGAPIPMSGMAAVMVDEFKRAIETVVHLRNEAGGILGGRPIEVVFADMKETPAQAAAATLKLVLEDGVSAIVAGGYTEAHGYAVAGVTEPEKILYGELWYAKGLIEDMNYTVGVHWPDGTYGDMCVKVANKLNAKTVGFLVFDDSMGRDAVAKAREAFDSEGIETVYCDYFPPSSMDLTPYLTTVKYENPDILFFNGGDPSRALICYKLIMTLGGWGDIQLVGLGSANTASYCYRNPGAEGMICWDFAVQGEDKPGQREYEEAYLALYGEPPKGTSIYGVSAVTDAVIQAIDLAGTDTDHEAIAKAARSGECEIYYPFGPVTVNEQGRGPIEPVVVKIVDGEQVRWDLE